MAAQHDEQIATSTARQALEERITARAYELYQGTPRKDRKTLPHYSEIAERELTAAPKPSKPTKAAAE